MRKNTTVTVDGIRYEVEYDIRIDIRNIVDPTKTKQPDCDVSHPAWSQIEDRLNNRHELDY